MASFEEVGDAFGRMRIGANHCPAKKVARLKKTSD
jgi:hypothetical protein